jgi:hypothetical protein
VPSFPLTKAQRPDSGGGFRGGKRFEDLCETHAVFYPEMRKKSWIKRGLLPADIEA